MANTNNQKFLTYYKRLEGVLEEKYNLNSGSNNSSAIIRYYHELRKSYSFRDQERAVKLDVARTIRNTMAHEDVNAAITVTDEYVEFLAEEIRRLIDPTTALEVSFKIAKAFTCSLDDLVHDVMKVMVKQGYSHVPVMDNGYLVGVFSQKILFHRLYDEPDLIIDPVTTIADFSAYLPIEKHRSEQYVFVARTETIDNITRMFEKNRGEKSKIGLIFVTEHGKREQKILGFITPYDLIYF